VRRSLQFSGLPNGFSAAKFSNVPLVSDRHTGGKRQNVTTMHAKLVWVWVGFLCCALSSAAASFTNDVYAFGLRHSVITNAELAAGVDYEEPLSVINTAFCYGETNCPSEEWLFGVSIHLEAADAGIFVSPYAERRDGTSLEGIAYGTVGGQTNALIGSVKGTRRGYGEYFMDVDFSALGATSYVYQVYFHDLLTLTTTNSDPSTFVYTGNHDPQPPRVNPLWLKDGRPAVILDFRTSIAEIFVPGYHVHASRVVVTPMTSQTVDVVSRIDVLGSSGLPGFTLGDERVGKFQLYHQAIGNVHFGVKPSQLTLSNVVSAPGYPSQGMFTELPQVQRFEATLVPYAMTNDAFVWSFDAAGMSVAEPYPVYLGGVRVAGTNGVLYLESALYSTSATLRVYHQGTLAGTFFGTNGPLGTLTGSNLVMASYMAAGSDTNESAYVGFRLGSTVTFSNESGTTLTGDEFRVSPTDPDNLVRALTLFTMAGANLGEVTLAGMQTVTRPSEPLRLDIAKTAQGARVSWPYSGDYYLYGKKDLNDDGWNYVSYGIFENWRSYADVPTTNSSLFMRLQHIYAGALVQTNLNDGPIDAP
jgi:hypothetical protein